MQNKSLNKGVILLGQFVFDHFSALYHELDAVEFADINRTRMTQIGRIIADKAKNDQRQSALVRVIRVLLTGPPI
jgi:hypothetical protein